MQLLRKKAQQVSDARGSGVERLLLTPSSMLVSTMTIVRHHQITCKGCANLSHDVMPVSLVARLAA